MDSRRIRRPRPAIGPHPAPLMALKLALIRAHSGLVRAASALLSGKDPFAGRSPGPEAAPRREWAGRDAIRARPRRSNRAGLPIAHGRGSAPGGLDDEGRAG